MINLLSLDKNGVINNGSLNASGSMGGWWTSTTAPNAPANAYNLALTYTNTLQLSIAGKGAGYNVRCIFDT
jgi:hypothetical protein